MPKGGRRAIANGSDRGQKKSAYGVRKTSARRLPAIPVLAVS
jgi:hypothetical protein